MKDVDTVLKQLEGLYERYPDINAGIGLAKLEVMALLTQFKANQ